MSKKDKAMILLAHKGYKIDKDGKILNPRGRIISGIRGGWRGRYICISARFKNQCITVKAHRLQAYQKYGNKIFDEGILVRHKNGNPGDNSWDNILIGTHSDNMMDIPEEDRRRKSSHPKHDHEAIIKDRNNGMKYKDLMNKHGVKSKSTLSFILNKSMASESL